MRIPRAYRERKKTNQTMRKPANTATHVLGVACPTEYSTRSSISAMPDPPPPVNAPYSPSPCAISMTAWWYRRERHLGINSIVYTLAILWEIKQTAHHWERCVEATSADTEAA